MTRKVTPADQTADDAQSKCTKRLRVNRSWTKQFPNNCPLIEVDGDGQEVGTCAFYAPNGICPRHGDWRKMARPRSRGGRPELPKGERLVRIQGRIPPELKDWYVTEAAHRKITLSRLVSSALAMYRAMMEEEGNNTCRRCGEPLKLSASIPSGKGPFTTVGITCPNCGEENTL